MRATNAKTATELRIVLLAELDALVERLDADRQPSQCFYNKSDERVAKARYYELYDYRESLRTLFIDGVRIPDET